jgi:uncharacterized protein
MTEPGHLMTKSSQFVWKQGHTEEPIRGEHPMKGELDGVLVRVFIKETDKHKRQSLANWIVATGRKHGVAVAIANHSMMGYVLDGKIATQKIVDLSINLPVIVELIGDDDVMEQLVPELVAGVRQGVIVSQKIVMTICTPN